jgi:hypothetical protein
VNPTESDVLARIEPLRRLVNPDGADVTVVGFDDAEGRLWLRLDLTSADCADCVMPKQFLEGMFLDKLRRDGWPLSAVEIDDPRQQ